MAWHEMLSDSYEASSTGFRQPGCHGFSALDPWLCVPAFQRVCPFALYPYPILFNDLNVNLYSFECRDLAPLRLK